MTNAHSKLTSQGQISIPLDVRRKLGVGPGSILEWEEDGARMIVRRVARHSSEDIHKALFGKRKPHSHTAEEMNEGIRASIRARHAGIRNKRG